jgi:hypothetical protein
MWQPSHHSERFLCPAGIEAPWVCTRFNARPRLRGITHHIQFNWSYCGAHMSFCLAAPRQPWSNVVGAWPGATVIALDQGVVVLAAWPVPPRWKMRLCLPASSASWCSSYRQDVVGHRSRPSLGWEVVRGPLPLAGEGRVQKKALPPGGGGGRRKRTGEGSPLAGRKDWTRRLGIAL